MKLYVARAISGEDYNEIVRGYERIAVNLEPYYTVYHAMVGKGHLRNDLALRAHGYEHPVSTNHAIIERDRWMVKQCDVFIADLVGTERVSIGSMMELAWAHDHGIHTVVVVEPDNVHYHAFVLEAADIVYHELCPALEYLRILGASLLGVEV